MKNPNGPTQAEVEAVEVKLAAVAAVVVIMLLKYHTVEILLRFQLLLIIKMLYWIP